MTNGLILWADDEIDLLKPHIMFLNAKGYEVVTVSNGRDALDAVAERRFDLVILDENMPGLSGLETLSQIKITHPDVPVIMITKSEEENIMNQAIGNKIADYLIKPVNPNQILMTLKKHLHKREIFSEQTTTNYRQEFAQIGMQISDRLSVEEWKELYKKLINWDLRLNEADNEMHEMLRMQREEANNMFMRFVKNNYEQWVNDADNRPMISPDIFKKKIFPMHTKGLKGFQHT